MRTWLERKSADEIQPLRFGLEVPPTPVPEGDAALSRVVSEGRAINHQDRKGKVPLCEGRTSDDQFGSALFSLKEDSQ